MPVGSPSGAQPQFGTQFAIGDLVNEVLLRCGNRTTDAARASIWIRDALLEITADVDLRDEFDELEIYGTPFCLTGSISAAASVQEYAFANIVPSGSYNMSTLDIMLFTDPPTNSNRIRLNTTSYQDADRINPFPGQPTKWYRFNDLIGFSPTPDKNYKIISRLYQMHPINDGNLNATIILIARDWIEVIVYAAVLRAFIETEEYEKAQGVRTLLYGDPKYPERVGLIEARKKRRMRENWRRQGALRPTIRRYGSRG